MGWGAISAVVGPALGGAANYISQERTNKANAVMSAEQMNFQERMSNTAHQREVKDLIAAGLNPNLSAGGNGASSPSGASATMTAPQIDMPSIFQAVQANQEQQKIDIQKETAAADISKKLTDQELTKMKKILAQKGQLKANVEGKASKYIEQFMNYLEKQFKSNQTRAFQEHKEKQRPLNSIDIENKP